MVEIVCLVYLVCLVWLGEAWFIRLRRNTLQRTVAQAMARRRLAAGMKGKANYGEIPL